MLPSPTDRPLSEQEKMLRWGLQVVEGARVDCKDEHGNWSNAVVISASKQKVKVHFLGFHTDFDETFAREEVVDRLRPKGTMCSESVALVLAEGDKLEVEKVMNRRVVDDVEEYLVRWAGYTDEDMTWEKLHGLRDSKGCLPDPVVKYLSSPVEHLSI